MSSKGNIRKVPLTWCTTGEVYKVHHSVWGHVYLTQKEQNIFVFNASKVNAFILSLVKYKWKYTFSMTSSSSLQFRWALFYPIFLSRKRCFELAVFQALPKLEILGPKLFHWHQSKAPLSSKLPVQPQPCLWGTQTDSRNLCSQAWKFTPMLQERKFFSNGSRCLTSVETAPSRADTSHPLVLGCGGDG